MSRREPVEVIRDLDAAFEEGDVGRALSLIAEDVEWDNRGADAIGVDQVYVGHEGMMDMMGSVLDAFGEYSIEERAYEARGHRVLVVARERATGVTSGLTFDRPLGILYEVRQGKVVRASTHADVDEARRRFEAG